jgi:hypothetical protein
MVLHRPVETARLCRNYGLAAVAEMAMYESLATAGAVSEAQDVVSLARTLQGEQRNDCDQVWDILKQSAADSTKGKVGERGAGTLLGRCNRRREQL